MFSLNLQNSFSRLMLVYVFWLASWILAGSLFEVYFFNLGLGLSDIYLASLFWFIGGAAAVFFRGFEVKKFMLLGIALAFLSVAVLYLFPHPLAAYPFRFLMGLTHFFFWVPFNTIYYESRKGNHALLGAVYYSIMPLLSLALPALAGWLASGFGYPILFLAAMLSYALTFLLGIVFLEKREYSFQWIESLRSMAGLRSLVFLEGFAGTVLVSVTLEIALLLYINEPFEFGGFVSLAMAFSILASLLTARLSDRYKSRRIFLFASVAGFAFSAIFASQAQTVAVFFLGFGLINFSRTIFFPLPFALTVDNSKSLVDTMVGRELMLLVGRLAGAAVGYVILVYTSIQTVLLFQGLALLLYIPLFEWKRKKLQRS